MEQFCMLNENYSETKVHNYDNHETQSVFDFGTRATY